MESIEIDVGLSQEAKEFLSQHDAKIIGQWKMAFSLSDMDYIMGNIYEVNLGENELGNTLETLIEFRQDTVVNRIGDRSEYYIYTALMQIPRGERSFLWKNLRSPDEVKTLNEKWKKFLNEDIKMEDE